MIKIEDLKVGMVVLCSDGKEYEIISFHQWKIYKEILVIKVDDVFVDIIRLGQIESITDKPSEWLPNGEIIQEVV